MLFVAIFVIFGGTAIVFGVPAGIFAGIKSAAADVATSRAFLRGARIVLFLNGLIALAIGAFFVFFWLGQPTYASSSRLSLPDLYQNIWVFTGLFVILPAVFWLPVYTVIFWIARYLTILRKNKPAPETSVWDR